MSVSRIQRITVIVEPGRAFWTGERHLTFLIILRDGTLVFPFKTDVMRWSDIVSFGITDNFVP